MMENKLWAALCALLLINLGSAENAADGGTSPSSKNVPETPPPPTSTTASVLTPISHAAPTNASDTIHSPSVSSGTSNETATEEKTISTPVHQITNDTKVASPPPDAEPEKNLTDHLTSQPSVHSTSQSPLVSINASTTQPAHTDSVKITLSTAPLTNTPHHSEFLPPNPITESNQPIPNPSAPASESPTTKTSTASTTTITTTTSTQSNTTSSTSSSKEPPTSKSSSLQPDHLPENSVDHQTSTILPTSNPTAQAKARADNPSQLNVGGDTTVVHDSPTLDPLLAGLVSAFIITAVIITLLLFLKLRRRDNRPEFRRLQDLPMDDMMEDTPLSMYSY